MMEEVRIVWRDSRSEDSWTDPKDLDMRSSLITTLGHLVSEDDELICVASSVDDKTGQLSGILFIPRACVVETVTFGQEHVTHHDSENLPAV